MWFSTFLLLNLFRRRARSLLTVLGMAIAVGTSVALLGVAESFERSSVETFSSRGIDIVVLEKGILDQLSSDLKVEYGERIRKLPGVKAVAPGLIELVDFSHTDTVLSVVLQGWEPHTFLFDQFKILDGRAFDEGEHDVALIGSKLAEILNKKVGDPIDIQRQKFQIIGVYESFNIFENGAVTLPLKDLQRVMGRPDNTTGFSVILQESSDGAKPVDEVRHEIEALTDEQGNSLGLSAVATQDYANQSLHIRLIRAMAWATSLIALVVGAVGTLNTMLMSVVERLREISILRAIGWKRWRVARMILGECMLLSAAGAFVGIAGAALLLRWMATLPSMSGYINGDLAPVVIGKGALLAIVVALFGGGYPAWRATRLTPVEGLSHE